MLTHYPDAPTQAPPEMLNKWQDSGNFRCEQKVDGWRMILIRTNTREKFTAVTRHNRTEYSVELCSTFREDLDLLAEVIPLQSELDSEWFGRRLVESKLPPRLYIFDAIRWGSRWLINDDLEKRIKLIFENIFDKLPLTTITKIPTPEKNERWIDYFNKQKKMPESEGVVVKCLRGPQSKMRADRRERKKAYAQFKVKYRGGFAGDVEIH